MDTKTLLKKEYPLRPTRLDEDFEQGQPELDTDMTLGSGPSDSNFVPPEQEEKWARFGQKVADHYSEIIMRDARAILRQRYNGKNIDIEAQAASAGMSPEDLLMEDDDFFQIVSDLSYAFVHGIQDNWVMPFLDD